MSDFLLSSQKIYNQVVYKEHKLYKTIVFHKEFYEIIGNNDYLDKINQIIQQIDFMNKHQHLFVSYQYEIKTSQKDEQIILSQLFLPSLDLFVKRKGFSKEYLDILVEDISKALDCIDFHGSLSMQNIFYDGCHFYLSDIQFYQIIYSKKQIKSKAKDLYEFVKIIYQIVKCTDLKNSLFFKKGLSYHINERYQTTEELRESYERYFVTPFLIDREEIDLEQSYVFIDTP